MRPSNNIPNKFKHHSVLKEIEDKERKRLWWFSNLYQTKYGFYVILMVVCVLFLFIISYKMIYKTITLIYENASINNEAANDVTDILNEKMRSALDLKFHDAPVLYSDIGSDSHPLPSIGYNKVNICSNRGVYISEKDSWVDCGLYCHDDNFHYRYIPKSNTVIHHNAVSFKSGGYCMPNKLQDCNVYTSYFKFDGVNWTCESKWPEMFNNYDITACNGSILDRLTNEIYTNTIPVGIDVGDDPRHETLLGTDKYRFICPQEETDEEGMPTLRASKYIQKDVMNNKMIPNPFNRFSYIQNYCQLFIYSSLDTITADWATEKCMCPYSFGSAFDSSGDQITERGVMSDGPCYKYPGGYNKDTEILTINRLCLTQSTRLNQLTKIKLDDNKNASIQLCGQENFNTPAPYALTTGKIQVTSQVHNENVYMSGLSTHTNKLLKISNVIKRSI